MKLVPLGDAEAAVCVDGVCEIPNFGASIRPQTASVDQRDEDAPTPGR